MRITRRNVGVAPVKEGPAGRDAYELAISRDHFDGSFTQWLESLKGRPGDKGDDGLDAYQIAVREGFTGNIDEWRASLRGKQGEVGPRGPRGPEGPIGPMPKHEWRGTELRFELRSGEWGEYVDLRGKPGRDAIGGIISSGSSVQGNSYDPVGF